MGDTAVERTAIDFVLPWVDGADRRWQAEKNSFLTGTAVRDDAAGDNRFRDWGTLRYVLRSIEANCPYYRRIYLITEGHVPEWLDTKHPKIRVITHRELFICPDDLPVFNSSAIEMNLVNLPDLAEHFVYLNDDTVFLRPVPEERLFRNGLPVDFLSHGFIPRNRLFAWLRGDSSWVRALNNNLGLINRNFSPRSLPAAALSAPGYSWKDRLGNLLMKYVFRRYVWLAHWHLPQPYTRSTLQAVFDSYGKEMRECSKNRFRADTDLTVYLNRYRHLASGQFFPEKNHDGFVRNIRTSDDFQAAAAAVAADENIRFVCLNDTAQTADETDFRLLKKQVETFFGQYLPHAATFERG